MKARRFIFTVIAAMAVGVGTGWGATNEVSGLLQKGLFEEEANHNLDAAIQAYQAVVTQTDKDHQFAATAIFRLGECYRKQGKTNEANVEYQRIVREFPDQTELVTLSRQQLGTAAGQVANGSVAGQTGGTPISAGLIAEIKKLGVEERRVMVQQLFPNPVLNVLMQKMTEAEQDLAVAKKNYGPDHPEVQNKVARLKTIYQQIDDQVEAVLATLSRQQLGNAAEQAQSEATTLADIKEKLEKRRALDLKAQGETEEIQEIKGLQAMLKDSPDLLNSHVYNDGGTRLHGAVRDGQPAVAKFLLDNGADINARNSFQYTPLLLAVEKGRKDMVELLLSRGAKVDVQTREGKTPLHLAAEYGYKTIAELLLAHGADINAPRLGMTPLMKAIAQNNTDTAKILLQHGADIKIQMPTDSGTWGGWTALRFAVDKNNAELVKLLLEKGADVNLKAQYGITPLIAAVEGKELEMAKLLLEQGAKVNARDDAGETPLHLAAFADSLPMVELLLAHGADVNAKDNEGNTPLDSTAKPRQTVKITERDQIRALLREHGGVAEVDIATIRVMRNGKLAPKIIFRKDRGGYNHFTLFELIANMYGEAKAVYDPGLRSYACAPEAGLEFPDFGKLKIIHLAENGRTNVEVVDLEKALAEGDCSKNISLKWGDVMEVPETDHKVTDVYGGLSQPAKDTLSKCLAREVEIRVKGQITKVKLSPDLSDARTGGHGRTDYFPGNNLHDTDPRFWLNQAVHSANVILASSDLTRVRVKRAGEEMVFNLEKMEPNSDLWLEDGDVIEIPEKTGE